MDGGNLKGDNSIGIVPSLNTFAGILPNTYLYLYHHISHTDSLEYRDIIKQGCSIATLVGMIRLPFLKGDQLELYYLHRYILRFSHLL